MKRDVRKFKPAEFEAKWQKKWRSDKTFSPDLDSSDNPYYTLMMFPYPSAEGMHVGNMYAHTGADIHGRYKRMQGKDVFEPIGLDGFGIHSENYAMKVGRHPKEQAEISEKNFYRQMTSTGSGFDWERTLETYDPEYYKWTQWLFTQMFKAGLAYKDKAFVNFCPSCKTVLADEQVIAGECERCGSIVQKRELEQWFFKITQYAGRLLDNLPGLDWTEKVKIAQTNWIGRSKGSLIRFPIADFRLKNGQKPNFVLIHGYDGSPDKNFIPWLGEYLTKLGYEVQIPDLPNSENPKEVEQVSYVLEKVEINENTIILGHSLGAVVSLKVLEKLSFKVAKCVLVGGFSESEFKDGKIRPYNDDFTWNFDWKAIQTRADEFIVLHDQNDSVISQKQANSLAANLDTDLRSVLANSDHFRGSIEPEIFKVLIPTIEAFTTRPDTIFGATFMVIAPEHPIVQESRILEYLGDQERAGKVKSYVDHALNKNETQRIAEGEEKTGVFSGLYAVNPATGEQIPVWVADYVLGGYGTGAIMAVPGHDERDNQFAVKYNLPIKHVIKPSEEVEENSDHFVYVGSGLLQNSGSLDGYHSDKDVDKILDFISENGWGDQKEAYHLRDWLISRQRYWGPPIPMIFCENCARQGKSWFDSEEAKNMATVYGSRFTVHGSKQKQTKNHAHEMSGWYPVPDSDLPVKLPDIQDFKPTGEGTSPLAGHPDFYEVTCPECSEKATRETDVSDTFLDSAWYFLRYLATDRDDMPFPSKDIAQRSKFLPVDIYIGGAEHSVLHLLYARFTTMVLHDLGYLDFEEPFTKFYAHGLLIKEGAKMSKSKGNVIVPDNYIDKYGADTLRSYLMFLGPFSQGGDFYDTGIEGMYRFLRRVWTLLVNRVEIGREDEKITRARHKTIYGVTKDMNEFGYNTALAKLMEFYNLITEGTHENSKIILDQETVDAILKMLAPFAPHMTEEIWQNQAGNGEFNSIHLSPWPAYDKNLIIDDELNIVIQVNGKRRGELAVRREDINNREQIESQAKELVNKYLAGNIQKVVYVPGKIINFVVR